MRHKIAFIGVCVFAMPLSGQVRRPFEADTSITRLVRRIGPSVSDQPLILSVLRSRVASRARKDSLGDSLLARALASRNVGPVDTARLNAGARAVVALGHSGMPRYAGSDPVDPGQVYLGALDRLIRIHRDVTTGQIPYHALRLMLSNADRRRGIEYVRDVATRRDGSSVDAVTVLILDARGATEAPQQTDAQREETRAVLRDLSARRSVKNPLALQLLGDWLSSQSNAR